MVFSSLIFTFVFLPAVLILYYLARGKARNYILLFASLLFYAYGEPKFVLVMLASIIANYFLALFISRAKGSGSRSAARIFLILDLCINLGILFVFKYLDFSISIINRLPGVSIALAGIALPIGISFFTFQALSYVIDVYRGTVEVQKNPLYVALYISFFPQLVAGPIVRYTDIEKQIESRHTTPDQFAEGIRRFFLGFGKKVILANNLAVAAEEIWGQDPSGANPVMLWIGALSFTLQIYYDFSGYSDMAIGLGKMFGFDFLENFNYPYIAGSATEFWRRWHMSLGSWFKDYVYFPMGGSRVKLPRQIFNMFVIWALTGIWHGAKWTYICWGLGYFIMLLIEKYIVTKQLRQKRAWSVIWRIVFIVYTLVMMVMFNSSSVSGALRYIRGMFGLYGSTWALSSDVIRMVREYGFFMVCGTLFAMPVALKLSEFMDRRNVTARIKAVALPIGYGLMFLWAVSYLVLGARNPFIYFNF